MSEFGKVATGWWRVPKGARNLITDVPGVQVGHATLLEGTARTGVTAIVPASGNLFQQKLEAGSTIINGFGKSAGLLQLQELGQLETPILLSNTFAVPVCTTALIKHAIEANPEVGRGAPTVNALALECNDGVLNDIQAFRVTEETARAALDSCGSDFELGSVGAGTGMKSFGFAGGIGSASRLVLADRSQFTLGALVLSNFGQRSEFRYFGQRLGDTEERDSEADKGSIIIVLATDAPLDSRQLTRISKRSAAALGRLGSYLGHGSGDIAVAFSTDLERNQKINETSLDAFFLATVEAVEEAVLRAMWHGKSRKGYDGALLPELRSTIKELNL